MADTVDFTRPPTSKERLKLQARLQRLGRPEHVARIDRVYGAMPGTIPSTGLVVRSGFSYRESDIDLDASDRKAPPRNQRPPATRLITSRGATLRFALTLLALVQTKRKPGAKARLGELGFGVAGSSRTLGLADLIVTDAADSNQGGVYLTARNKRARSVRSALAALAEAGLVAIPGEPGARDRMKDFVLLNECGVEAVGEKEEYYVPSRGEATFEMPAGFVANGWLHVLEDSEIALLLMVACQKGGWPENGLLVVPADVRLRHYGIHRDAYSSARKVLEWCGLLMVEEVARHRDGRAENAELRVHRLGLIPSGFEALAVPTTIEALARQITRF
ncbi:hypothetical protein FVA74_05955 [Salinibacterium sp. dk2585]|uniref:hypothetical protein n=1 Tax=unclassified Salinibacterium TaxID=2632331 RepID=UPI0011C246EB|nr:MULTISPECIES: hypothetical protein [unclassified Salinibacterium]QEE61169.1 hypothetical protein FVA74_05955 [Salinibacterium sp. dk2585]TXK53844.1 hypothetical protein FVP63_07405 [Salinibacterium sp. dk5596]